MFSISRANLENKWWMKWWVRETLTGSLAIAPLDELGFFVKLCCLSKQSNYPGFIKASETEPFSHSIIAGMIQTDLNTFERLLLVHIQKGRITEDTNGVITIENFIFYQSEKGMPTVAKRRKNYIPTSEYEEEERDKAKLSRLLNDNPDLAATLLAARGYKVYDKNNGDAVEANVKNMT